MREMTVPGCGMPHLSFLHLLRFQSSPTVKYNVRTSYVIKASPISPLLRICKIYTYLQEHIMKIFVMLNENNILSLSFGSLIGPTQRYTNTRLIKSRILLQNNNSDKEFLCFGC